VPVAGKVVPEVKEAADLGRLLGAKTAWREIDDYDKSLIILLINRITTWRTWRFR
jgi:hypothetical protein